MLLSVYNYVFGRNQQQHLLALSTNNIPQEQVTSNFDPRLQAVFKQLDALCPRFIINHNDITILNDPKQFYSTLKLKILGAKKRVFLSSLYVGKTQYELIETIDKALLENEDLTVSILTDALRGTREAPHGTCSATLLVTLVEKFGKHRVDIRMYHTPHLKGFTKSLAPKRINEAWGLQHMKLYGFDDEIILSGANLSEDYFTDRQDRYYVFGNANLTDYYSKIHHTVCSISYQILPSSKNPSGFRMDWPTSNKTCEPHMNHARFISDTSLLLEPLLKQQDLKNFEEYNDTHEFDTIVYPISQFTPLLQPGNDISTEKPSVLRLLTFLDSPKIKWWFTAGYFNMLPEIQQKLVNGLALGTIITASAKANSFYKSSGVSYYIPEAYLLIAKKFLEDIRSKAKDLLIKLYEWQNGVVNTPGGWSYHAKGIWITVPDEEIPSMTIIGSSNYTKRAYTLDLESNAIIITRNEELKQQMKDEIDNLMVYAKPLELSQFEPKLVGYEKDEEGNDIQEKPIMKVSEDRQISYRVHLGLKVIGGKL